MLQRIVNWLFPKRSVIFFTDCKDTNALSRVEVYLLALLKYVNIRVYGANSWQEIALSVYNILEIWKKNKSEGNVVVGNFAPRNSNWPNGAPFSFARLYGNLIVGTPECFSLLVSMNKLDKNRIYQTDIFTVCSKFMTKEEALDISQSQFRSLEYVPKLISWLLEGEDVPANNAKNIPPAYKREIFHIDNFGNILFAMSKNDVTSIECKFFKIGNSIECPVNLKEKLVDLEYGEMGLVLGSKGFVELICKGSNAASMLGVKLGDKIEFFQLCDQNL